MLLLLRKNIAWQILLLLLWPAVVYSNSGSETNDLTGKGLMCDLKTYPSTWSKYTTKPQENFVAIFFISSNELTTKFIRLKMNPKIQNNGVFNYAYSGDEITISALWQKSVINIRNGIWTKTINNMPVTYRCSNFMTFRSLDSEVQKRLNY